jgi:hypothetical protein
MATAKAPAGAQNDEVEVVTGWYEFGAHAGHGRPFSLEPLTREPI